MEDLENIIAEASNIGPAKPKKASEPVITSLSLLTDEVREAQQIDSNRLSEKSVDMAWKNFEQAVGGRKELISTLEHCPDDSNAIKAVKRLFQDKAFIIPSADSLRTICLRKQIPLNLVMAAFRDAKMAQVAIGAIAQLAKEAPSIVKQLAGDSKNRFEACVVCDGKARVNKIGENGEWLLNEDGDHITQLCYQCRGTGKTYKEHDFANRRAFLQITGILDERKGTVVNVNNQTAIINENFQPGNGTFEKLIKAIDSVNLIKKEEEEIIDVPYSIYDADPAIEIAPVDSQPSVP